MHIKSIVMLRKTGHIILLILFMVSTMGMTISKHYCGDHLKSVSILSPTDKCCDIPVGCCHDENISIEIEKDYSASSFNYEFSTVLAELPNFIELFLTDDTEMISRTEVFEQIPVRKMQRVLARLQTYLL